MTEPTEFRRLSEHLRNWSSEARPRADCPDPDRIWLAVRRELPIEERRAVVDHTTECAVCAESWRLAMECTANADADANLAEPASTSSQPRWWPPSVAGWALASAAVLILAAGSVYLIRPRGSADPIFRDPGTSALASEVAAGAMLAREDFRLRWTPGPPGARYNLTVTTEKLDVIADARGIERTEYHVPIAALSSVAPGTRLLWRVVAEMPEGGSTASPTYSVTVK